MNPEKNHQAYSIGEIVILTFCLVSASTPPANISCLASAHGRLFTGTFSGQVFVSEDTAKTWRSVGDGLCDTVVPVFKRTVECMRVMAPDSLRVTTGCGEFVAALNGLRFSRMNFDSCFSPLCHACVKDGMFAASVGTSGIRSSLVGPIEWSSDSGSTWTVAVPGCLVCSMPIVGALYFDAISALAGLSGGYCSMIGFNSSIIVSRDSGRTWKDSKFSGTGVGSIARLGGIAFAGTERGLYASRDDFSTWWLVGGAAVRQARGAPAGSRSGRMDCYALTGRKLRSIERVQGIGVVLERQGRARALRIRVLDRR